jgi:hypothetical protein
MLTSHLHLVPRLGMSGIVPLFPVFPPWYGQDSLHMCACVCVVCVCDVNFTCPVPLSLSIYTHTHTHTHIHIAGYT